MKEEDRNSLRRKLLDEMSKILLGPFDHDEKLLSSPSDNYLTGILWPKDTDFLPDDDEDLGGGDDKGDDQANDDAIPGYRAVRPCSLGITFSAPRGSVICITTANTARYLPTVEVEENGTDSGAEKQENESQGGGLKVSWLRKQLDYQLEIQPHDKSTLLRFTEFKNANGELVSDPGLEVHVKYRVSEHESVITATLINKAPNETYDDNPIDVNCLFQTGLEASLLQGSKEVYFLPRRNTSVADDPESQSNALIYRNVHEYAVGHGVSAEWSADLSGKVAMISTTWLPKTKVKGTSFSGHETLEDLRTKQPDIFKAEWLSIPANKNIAVKGLLEFCDVYESWIQGALVPLADKLEQPLQDAATINIKNCGIAAERIRRGILLLNENENAWRAFTLANSALNRQAHYQSKGARAGPLTWRPFQLAFILLVIPGLVNPEDDDRNTMDLLWFPTGGGKTEAYLGLTAFSIFYSRLTSELRRNQGGMDVLMRYTLRLLTVQQFQRAAALIVACESTRLENSQLLGEASIDLGLYVGDDSTPNKLRDAKVKLDEEKDGSRPRSSPRQLLNCPVCNGSLTVADYILDEDESILDIVCHTEDCEWQNLPLPVHTVDEIIYKSPPSLLIGTVDKFAQLPRKPEIGKLLGVNESRPPGLIIQDELHLISGPLGTVTGLYESAIDFLCSRDGVRPKVIGSTATIGYAEAQVRSLFDRSVLQFPPPGLDYEDSFFAVAEKDAEAPDRLYLGVSTAGRSPKFSLQAVLGTAMQSIATEHEAGVWSDDVVDPYWTTVAYFNSLRELGGAIVMALDDVPRTMQFVAGRQEANTRPAEQEPTELSSRIPSSQIPEQLNKLNIGIDDDDIYAGEPVDLVLASNMISVGVDVPRLGIMVVNGQPKSTAEYIQATSRVGRGLPGIVITVLNFGRPRDLSHFEHFQNYHSALYRTVEASSVTPWAPRSRDKALHAVLIAAIRQIEPKLLGDTAAREFTTSFTTVADAIEFLSARAKNATSDKEADEVNAQIQSVIKVWEKRALEHRVSGKKLRYWEAPAPFGKTAEHLMRDAERLRRTDSPGWPTPNSMREIEPSTAFVLKKFIDYGPETKEDENG